MEVIKTQIEGLLIIKPTIYSDKRGYFFESFSQKEFKEKVSDTVFVQDNESSSKYAVLRGLHYQKPPFAQAKLVRVVKGKVLDISVDMRSGSPTYAEYHSSELSEDNMLQLFVPRGFAHGFIVLSDEAVLQYKCDNYYSPEHERGVIWNDPKLNIDWKIPEREIILSDKDKKNPLFI